MHPGFLHYWNRRHACGSAWSYAACGPSDRARRGLDVEVRLAGGPRSEEDALFGAGALGVRRPLRFLAWRLELTPEQLEQAARILEQLKIERAQATVDLRRSAADLADAVAGGEFGSARIAAARERRLEAARRVQDAIARALEELHGLLDDRQRAQLARLIRTGEIRL
jgi:hypothetical protein